jgi:hypothetical protein
VRYYNFFVPIFCNDTIPQKYFSIVRPIGLALIADKNLLFGIQRFLGILLLSNRTNKKGPFK